MSKRQEINEYVGKFVTGLVKLMRESAHETVDATFSEEAPEVEAAPAKAPKARKAKRTKRAPKAAPAPTSSDVSPKELLAAVKAHPFAGTRVIADAVGRTPVQIRQGLNDLAAAGTIKKSGHGRGTTYSHR
jgi:hypothetical protein